jgi:hypothetical protein
MTTSKRLHFVDHVRVLVTLLVIAYLAKKVSGLKGIL